MLVRDDLPELGTDLEGFRLKLREDLIESETEELWSSLSKQKYVFNELKGKDMAFS